MSEIIPVEEIHNKAEKIAEQLDGLNLSSLSAVMGYVLVSLRDQNPDFDILSWFIKLTKRVRLVPKSTEGEEDENS